MNDHIVVAALLIGATGIIKSYSSQPPQPITPVIVGTYVFLLLLSLLDMFGGSLAEVASALAMLATISVVLTQFPWSTVLGIIQGKKT